MGVPKKKNMVLIVNNCFRFQDTNFNFKPFEKVSDLAEVRIHLAPTFTRSEPLTFLSLGLYEILNQKKKIPATISQMRDRSNSS